MNKITNLVLKKAILFFICITVGSLAHAADSYTGRSSTINNLNKAKQIGLGIQIGSLSGLSAQFWLDNVSAVNASVAGINGNTIFSIAHLWLYPDALSSTGRYLGNFVPYVGLGVAFASATRATYFSKNNENEKGAVAAQIPLGLEYLPPMQRFDIFAEVTPMIEVFPKSIGLFSSSIGARFFF